MSKAAFGYTLRYGPYTFISLTNQSVNVHIALNVI